MAKTHRIITATAILILSLPISPARKINKTYITTRVKRWGRFLWFSPSFPKTAEKVPQYYICILLSISASRKFHMAQFDVVTSFLNGDMQDEVYFKQVLGFIHPSKKSKVWKLKRSLYGTKQAARRWQEHFGQISPEFHLKATESDSAVYVMKNEMGIIIINFHVDDLLVFGDNKELLSSFHHFV